MQYTFNVKSWGDYKFPYTCQSEDIQEVAKNAASCVGCSVDDLELLSQKSDLEILRDKLPIELFQWASYYAYEQGHAYGEENVDSILQDIVQGLSEAVTKFYKRTCNGGKVSSIHFPQ
jgi:hypothetical protein